MQCVGIQQITQLVEFTSELFFAISNDKISNSFCVNFSQTCIPMRLSMRGLVFPCFYQLIAKRYWQKKNCRNVKCFSFQQRFPPRNPASRLSSFFATDIGLKFFKQTFCRDLFDFERPGIRSRESKDKGKCKMFLGFSLFLAKLIFFFLLHIVRVRSTSSRELANEHVYTVHCTGQLLE